MDLEALTELDRRAIDDLLELCSAPEQRGGQRTRAFPDKIDYILSWLGMRRIRIE
jgi:hypothetical protein